MFTGIFTVEAILKIIGMSKYYFLSNWNVLDFIIVVASLIDIAFQDIKGLSIIKVFRLVGVHLLVYLFYRNV